MFTSQVNATYREHIRFKENVKISPPSVKARPDCSLKTRCVSGKSEGCNSDGELSGHSFIAFITEYLIHSYQLTDAVLRVNDG